MLEHGHAASRGGGPQEQLVEEAAADRVRYNNECAARDAETLKEQEARGFWRFATERHRERYARCLDSPSLRCICSPLSVGRAGAMLPSARFFRVARKLAREKSARVKRTR